MKEFIINLVLIFIVKVIDNILGTSKTILIQKNKSFIASITVVISQIIFYKLIKKGKETFIFPYPIYYLKR